MNRSVSNGSRSLASPRWLPFADAASADRHWAACCGYLCSSCLRHGDRLTDGHAESCHGGGARAAGFMGGVNVGDSLDGACARIDRAGPTITALTSAGVAFHFSGRAP